MSEPTHDEPDAGAGEGKAPSGEGSGAEQQPKPKGKAKRPRSPKQIAQFEAMRAKRWADKQSDKARAAGVDTTSGAQPATQPERAGAPKVVTTPHQSPPTSPEQAKRRAEGKPAPDAADLVPDPKPAPEPTGERPGLLAIIAEAFGL